MLPQQRVSSHISTNTQKHTGGNSVQAHIWPYGVLTPTICQKLRSLPGEEDQAFHTDYSTHVKRPYSSIIYALNNGALLDVVIDGKVWAFSRLRAAGCTTTSLHTFSFLLLIVCRLCASAYALSFIFPSSTTITTPCRLCGWISRPASLHFSTARSSIAVLAMAYVTDGCSSTGRRRVLHAHFLCCV